MWDVSGGAQVSALAARGALKNDIAGRVIIGRRVLSLRRRQHSATNAKFTVSVSFFSARSSSRPLAPSNHFATPKVFLNLVPERRDRSDRNEAARSRTERTFLERLFRKSAKVSANDKVRNTRFREARVRVCDARFRRTKTKIKVQRGSSFCIVGHDANTYAPRCNVESSRNIIDDVPTKHVSRPSEFVRWVNKVSPISCQRKRERKGDREGR